MSKRLYPHNRVRYWYAYDIDDICGLFDDIGLHPQTVRKWVKSGLSTIDKGRPTLIYGNDLINFLKKHNQSNKRKTAFDEFYCMKCQDARPIFQNKIHIVQKAQFLRAQGHCRTCKSKMNKSYKMTDYPALKRKFKLVDVLELYDCSKPTDKTHFSDEVKQPVNESYQLELL